jgi:hypothetical protein
MGKMTIAADFRPSSTDEAAEQRTLSDEAERTVVSGWLLLFLTTHTNKTRRAQ